MTFSTSRLETDYLRAAYSGTALAFRDRLIIDWNKTQQRQTFADQKRIYCVYAKARIGLLLTFHRPVPGVLDGQSLG
jgi:starch phosphorylase